MNHVQPASRQLVLPAEPSSAEPVNTPVNRALQATEAGGYLAQILGLSRPYTAQQMWAMARKRQVPVVRIGRRTYWQTLALDRFVESGGTEARGIR